MLIKDTIKHKKKQYFYKNIRIYILTYIIFRIIYFLTFCYFFIIFWFTI